MVKRSVCVAVALVAASLGGAGQLSAQDLDLNILNGGKPPAAPIPVSVMEDGEKRQVATTDANGHASFDMGSVDIATGTSVDVYVVNCQEGRTEVVLVPAGEGDPCADQEAAAGERCECEKVTAFAWGTTNVSFDIGQAPVTAPKWTVGLGLGASYFYNIEDVGCEGTQNCDLSKYAPTFRLNFEWRPSDRVPVGIGAEFNYTSLGSINQTYSSGTTNRVDMDLLGFGAYGFLAPKFKTVFVNFGFGLYGAYNVLDLSTDDGSGVETGERSDTQLKIGTQVGLDWPISNRFGLRAEFSTLFGDGKDADENLGLSAWALYYPGGIQW